MNSMELDFSLGTAVPSMLDSPSPNAHWWTGIDQGLLQILDVVPFDGFFGKPVPNLLYDSAFSGTMSCFSAPPTILTDPKAQSENTYPDCRTNDFGHSAPSNPVSETDYNKIPSQDPAQPIPLQLTVDGAVPQVSGFWLQAQLPSGGSVKYHLSPESNHSPSDSAPNISDDAADKGDHPDLQPRTSIVKHNIAEKRYRKRISAQFCGLLKVLPKTGAYRSTTTHLRRPMILEQARKHIRELEDRLKSLETNKRQLMARLHSLQSLQNQSGANGFGQMQQSGGRSSELVTKGCLLMTRAKKMISQN